MKNRTADIAYKQHRKSIDIKIEKLKSKLIKDDAQFNKTDWGWVGSMEAIDNNLTEILNFLGD